MDSQKSKTILIVGAGPVGLSAAVFLTYKNVNFRIVDKLPEPISYSKALSINSRTMELFDKISLAEEIVKNSFKVKSVNYYRNNFLLFTNDLSGINHKFPFICIQEQSQSEKYLTDILIKKNVRVERGINLKKLIQTDKFIECELEDVNGKVEISKFDYIFSPDGAHSSIRKLLDLNFIGDGYDEPWYLIDAILKTKLNPFEINIFLLDTGFMFITRIKDHIWRIGSNNKELFKELPKDTFIENILWESNFKISHRIIEKFNTGNIYFGGDAAHVHSPVGGRGMNLGIEDAYIFAELFEKNRLDEYNQIRMKTVKEIVSKINFISDIIRGKSLLSKILRYLCYFSVPFLFQIFKKSFTLFFFGLDTNLPNL